MADQTPVPEPDYLSLKWGTLKAWHLHSVAALAVLRRYVNLGISIGAMTQHDTPEQKRLICELIDTINAPTIHLDWDDIDVSKDEAKKYVMNYGQEIPDGR